MEFKSRIGKLIAEKGYKRSFVAKKVGVGDKQLYNWCAGRSYPPVPKLFKLADILDCAIEDLYEVIECEADE